MAPHQSDAVGACVQYLASVSRVKCQVHKHNVKVDTETELKARDICSGYKSPASVQVSRDSQLAGLLLTPGRGWWQRRDCIITTNGGNKRCGALSDMQSLIPTFANILKPQ